MTRLLVGPFNRVEGDLEVSLDIAQGKVQHAYVNATLFRGFEQILHNKPALDSLVYVPRICGICSVSQSIAAARALADAMQISAPPNGILLTNIMQACENAADHLSHFFLFFMPDFTREIYAQHPWHAAALSGFAAQQGEYARLALAARARWLTIMGTLGGKWPHTHAIQPGGVSRPITAAEKNRLLGKVREFRSFLEKTLFADSLENVCALSSEADLWRWHAQAKPSAAHLFLTISNALKLDQMGKGPERYLSYGAYPNAQDGVPIFAQGVWQDQAAQPLDLRTITEDACRAWLTNGVLHPQQGVTQVDADKPDAYTWNKAPRLAGQVCETGALARQMLAAHPLVRAAVARAGGTVYTRVLARLWELAALIPHMEQWLQAVRMNEAFCLPAPALHDADGVGLNEAARGSLGHWISVRGGKIANYQIIAPTTWNFSPRDTIGVPGALEAALVGAEVLPGETTPVSVQHIVRSFDPCMVCTVH